MLSHKVYRFREPLTESAPKRRKTVPKLEWDAHKERICQLYLRNTLKDVVQTMTAYGLNASEAQYVRQLKKWGVIKNKRSDKKTPGRPCEDAMEQDLPKSLREDRRASVEMGTIQTDACSAAYQASTPPEAAASLQKWSQATEKSPDEPKCQFATCSPKSTISSNLLDFDSANLQGLNLLGIDSLEGIRQAADFYLCLDLHDESYQLNAELWRRAPSRTDLAHTTISMISYICSAKTDEEIQALISSASKELYNDRPSEAYQLLCQLIYLTSKFLGRQGLTDPATLESTSPDFRRVSGLLWHLQGCDRYLKFTLFRFASAVYNATGRSADSAKLKHQIAQQLPGPFELRNHIMQNPLLRLYLSWCHGILSTLDIAAAGSDAVLGMVDIDWRSRAAPRAAAKSLFCLFWARWKGQKGPWTQLPEAVEVFTISTAQTLRICSALITNLSMLSFLQSIDASEPYHQAFLFHAGRSAKELLNWSDDRLVYTFLDVFVRLLSLPQQHNDDWVSQESKTTLRIRARTLAQELLQVDLSDLYFDTQSTIVVDEGSSVFSEHRSPGLRSRSNSSMTASIIEGCPSQDNDPVIAPSLSSSDLSFKRFVEFAIKRKKKTDRSLEACRANFPLFDEVMSEISDQMGNLMTEEGYESQPDSESLSAQKNDATEPANCHDEKMALWEEPLTTNEGTDRGRPLRKYPSERPHGAEHVGHATESPCTRTDRPAARGPRNYPVLITYSSSDLSDRTFSSASMVGYWR